MHDPELTAAAYLAGELSADERERFEQHLIDCEACWKEVDAGRRGMTAVEGARELAPSHLRERIRKAIGKRTPAKPRNAVRIRLLAAAAVLILGAGGSAAFLALRDTGSEPRAIAAAISGYTTSRLPGSSTTESPAPDLSSLHLTEVGAGAGRLGGVAVTAFMYHDESGRRLMVYVGTRSFPAPDGATPLHGEAGPWVYHRDGVAVLCARHPHELLIVGKDETLVRAAATMLDVM
jgi:hypothetical protein